MFRQRPRLQAAKGKVKRCFAFLSVVSDLLSPEARTVFAGANRGCCAQSLATADLSTACGVWVSEKTKRHRQHDTHRMPPRQMYLAPS